MENDFNECSYFYETAIVSYKVYFVKLLVQWLL